MIHYIIPHLLQYPIYYLPILPPILRLTGLTLTAGHSNNTSMSQPDPPSFPQLQQQYELIVREMQRFQSERSTADLENEIILRRVETKRAEEKDLAEKAIGELTRRVGELEELCKRQETEQNERNRRQIRKYVESLNEKDGELNALRRQTASLKGRISSLENEIANLNSAKDDLEVFVVRQLEQLKASIKDANNTLSEIDTEKLVIGSKYKQLNEKTNLLLDNISELTSRKAYLEEGYEKLKTLYSGSRNECIQLKFQVQKLKTPSQNLPDSQPRPCTLQQEEQIMRQIQQIMELNNVLKQRELFLHQINQFRAMNVELIIQNNHLKVQLATAEQLVQEYRIKYDQGFEDQLVQAKEPSLFQFLKEKKQKLVQFQANLEKIENYIEKRDEEINQIIRDMSAKQIGCSCGKQAELEKLQTDYESAVKKADHALEIGQKIRKDNNALQKLIMTYRSEIKELVLTDINKKGAKKRVAKKRCYCCFLPYEKNEHAESCSDCQKLFHKDCVIDHECDLMRLEENCSNLTLESR